MFRALLRQANVGLLTSTLLFLLPSQPTYADTILVGTNVIGPPAGVSLCPTVANCSNLFSQFSTPQPFVVEDVSISLTGPNPGFSSTDGSFQISIITNPGSSQTVVGNVGSGSVTLHFEGVSEYGVGFSGLSIPLSPGIEYYLEVTGGNLGWEVGVGHFGIGTLGQQLSCDPFVNCAQGVSFYNVIPVRFGELISGSIVPEPSTWLLLATGLFMLGGLVYFNSGRKHPSLN